ncbi:MAG TPA: hypothetical protein VFU43_13750 [Streptosporangiaceae bacterium]|nr:hypothetical protein [Streptosporangiaceae bacterium]
MSERQGIYRTGNPFAPRSADRLGGFPSTAGIGVGKPRRINVETDAMANLREEVENYFRRPERGRALALVGPYGAGKTHLTRQIINLVREQGAPPLWMIDGAIIDLGDVYQDRLMSLREDRNQKDAFEDLVSDYLSDVTAAELERLEREDSPTGEGRADIAKGLREREYDPEKVARTLRLDTELIHRDLRRHLSEITEHRTFATALALLLENDFNRIVWDWLSGFPPQQPLKDRGILNPIRGINPTFETLAVFAFMYGSAGKPYVLVIDALENVLGWPEQERTRFLDAFQRLVNVYISRGGLLMFCIPPDPLRELPQSLHERTLQFWLTGLSPAQTADLIRQYVAPHRAALEHRNGSGDVSPPADEDASAAVDQEASAAAAAELAPFTPDAVTEICELLNGNPRWILTTCSECWNIAEGFADSEKMIDVLIVHDAVRALFEQVTREHVVSVIQRTLTDGQWRTEPRSTRFAGRPEDVDFWVRVGTTSRLAIMIRRSILTGEQVAALERDITAARQGVPGAVEVLVVVNGLVSPRLHQQIVDIARTQPVRYNEQDFPERLHTSLTELTRRLEDADKEGYAAALRDRVGLLAGHQAEVIEQLRQLDSRLDRLVVRGDRPGALPTSVEGAELPEALADRFREASQALDLLSEDLASGPGVSPGGEEAGTPAGTKPHRLGFTAEEFQALGAMTMMRLLLESFQRDVADWLRTVPRGPRDPGATEEHWRRLFVICRSFEITTEVMPLGDLEARAASGETRPSGSARIAGERRRRALRRAEAEDVINRLAARVRKAAIDAVTTGGAGATGGTGATSGEVGEWGARSSGDTGPIRYTPFGSTDPLGGATGGMA